jgi:hypothetical protein
MLTPSLQAEKKTRKYENTIVRKQLMAVLGLLVIVPGVWFGGRWINEATIAGRKYNYFEGQKMSPAGVPIEPTTTRLPIVLPTWTASPSPPTASPKPPSDFGVRVKTSATQTAQAITK